MANGHGGSRPGAGQKKRSTEEKQATNRDLILQAVTPEDVLTVFTVALDGAKAGNPDDRKWLTPFLFGNPETIHKLTGDKDNPLKVLIEMVGDRA